MSTSIEKSAVLAVRVWDGWTDLTACCCWTELSCFLPLFITTQSLTLFLLQWLRCSLCPSLAKFTKRTDFCQVSELVGLMITRASSGYGVRTSWKGQQDVVLNGSEPLDETGCALALLLLLRKGEGCVQYPLQPEGTPAWVFCLPRNNFAFLPPPGCLGPCVQAWLSRAPSGPFRLFFLLAEWHNFSKTGGACPYSANTSTDGQGKERCPHFPLLAQVA